MRFTKNPHQRGMRTIRAIFCLVDFRLVRAMDQVWAIYHHNLAADRIPSPGGDRRSVLYKRAYLETLVALAIREADQP